MAYAKAIELNSDDVEHLQSLVRTRTIQAQVVDRAKMLLYKAQGESNRNIATRLDVNINTVKLVLCQEKVQVKHELFLDIGPRTFRPFSRNPLRHRQPSD